MGSVWRHHAEHLANLITEKDELKAHLYLEQLMLFPVDIQDKIIEDIAKLPRCSTDDIAEIISYYTTRV
ncbi:hypothetical protein FE810_06420 [Thalassotalea litorea]|uniref:Uncharacterized protein n=1 Tax=Thalassotalea litorea TaxID=2020715 RepID=A0A5R9IPC0_9GAMM|nr:hypothetical protein [Thalassotalea litorea]TLU66323.1 hypothetical protein FE810_06420 [Thalassotalea litorea]